VTDREELSRRLRELVGEAREAGVLPALEASWAELLAEPAAPREESAPPPIPGRFGMVGQSPPMQAVFDLIEKVAPTNVPVLVLGETGTGKELVARALHRSSPRAKKPFQAENCAAIPATLLESELFGHVKGSFTGAIADRPGTFVSAHEGTVFLDEIGDMPLQMQSKLLRVLQNGEVRPVGSNKVRKVDVRLVAATNQDLSAVCAEKTFREDLYYRLNVITIGLPPLRERLEDLPFLVAFFLLTTGKEMERPFDLAPEALEALRRHNWPGNVRELENELRRAAVFSSGRIVAEDLSPRLTEGV
jgi:transcriptional regulator with GAF, ATPase, and Fis domain